MNMTAKKRVTAILAVVLVAVVAITIVLSSTVWMRASDGPSGGTIVPTAGSGDYAPTDAPGFNGNIQSGYNPSENLTPVGSVTELYNWLNNPDQSNGVKLTRNIEINPYTDGTFVKDWPEGKILDGMGYTITTKLFANDILDSFLTGGRNEGQRGGATVPGNNKLPFGNGNAIYASGVFRQNLGTIRNCKFVIAGESGGSKSYMFDQTQNGRAWSGNGFAIGGVVGVNVGAIDNCFVEYTYETAGMLTVLKFNNKGSKGYGYADDCYLLFGGIAAQTCGTISNTKVNFSTDISMFSRGGDKNAGVHRVFAGGFAGTVGTGGNVYNVTLVGDGNIYAGAGQGAAYYKDVLYTSGERDYIAMSGGVVGINTSNGRLYQRSDITPGSVRNVFSTWTGNTSAFVGGRFTVWTARSDSWDYATGASVQNALPNNSGDGVHYVYKDGAVHNGMSDTLMMRDGSSTMTSGSYKLGTGYDNPNAKYHIGYKGTVLVGGQGDSSGKATCYDFYYMNTDRTNDTGKYGVAAFTFGNTSGYAENNNPNYTIVTSNSDNGSKVRFGWSDKTSDATPQLVYTANNVAQNAMLWEATRNLDGKSQVIKSYRSIDSIASISQLQTVSVSVIDAKGGWNTSGITFTTGSAKYYNSDSAKYGIDGSLDIDGTTVPSKQYDGNPIDRIWLQLGYQSDGSDMSAYTDVSGAVAYQWGSNLLSRDECKRVGEFTTYLSAVENGERSNSIALCDSNNRVVSYIKDDIAQPGRTAAVAYVQAITPKQVTPEMPVVKDGTDLSNLIYRGGSGYEFLSNMPLGSVIPGDNVQVQLKYFTESGLPFEDGRIPANAAKYSVVASAITGSYGMDGITSNYTIVGDAGLYTRTYEIQPKQLVQNVRNDNIHVTYNGQQQFPSFNKEYAADGSAYDVWFEGIVEGDIGVITAYAPEFAGEQGSVLHPGIDAAPYRVQFGLSGATHQQNYKFAEDGLPKVNYEIDKRAFSITVTQGFEAYYKGLPVAVKDNVQWEIEAAAEGSNTGVLAEDMAAMRESVDLYAFQGSMDNPLSSVLNAGEYKLAYGYDSLGFGNYQSVEKAQVGGDAVVRILPRKVQITMQYAEGPFVYNGESVFNVTGFGYTGDDGNADANTAYGVLRNDMATFGAKLQVVYTNTLIAEETYTVSLAQMLVRQEQTAPMHAGTYKMRLECMNGNYVISEQDVTLEETVCSDAVDLTQELTIAQADITLQVPSYVRQFLQSGNVWIEGRLPYPESAAFSIKDSDSQGDLKYYTAQQLGFQTVDGTEWMPADAQTKLALSSTATKMSKPSETVNITWQFESNYITRDYNITYTGNYADGSAKLTIYKRYLTNEISIDGMPFNEETNQYEHVYDGTAFFVNTSYNPDNEIGEALDLNFTFRITHNEGESYEDVTFIKWAGTYEVRLSIAESSPYYDCFAFDNNTIEGSPELVVRAVITPVQVYVDLAAKETTYLDAYTHGASSDGSHAETLSYYFYTLDENGDKVYFDINKVWENPDSETVGQYPQLGYGLDKLHVHYVIDGVAYCDKLGNFPNTKDLHAGAHTFSVELVSERTEGIPVNADKEHWRKMHVAASYQLMTEGQDTLVAATWTIDPKPVDIQIEVDQTEFVFDGQPITEKNSETGHAIVTVNLGEGVTMEYTLAFKKQLAEGQWSELLAEAIEAGKYQVTVDFTDNPDYIANVTEPKEVTIQPKQVTLTMNTPQGAVYNGKGIEVELVWDGLVAGFDPQFALGYYLKNAEGETKLEGAPLHATAAGESYLGEVVLAQDGNYVFADGNTMRSAEYTVAKADRVLSESDVVIKVYYNRIVILAADGTYVEYQISYNDIPAQAYADNTITGLLAMTDYNLGIAIPETQDYNASEIISVAVRTGYSPVAVNDQLVAFGDTLRLEDLNTFGKLIEEFALVGELDRAEIDMVAYNSLLEQYNTWKEDLSSVVNDAQSITAKVAHKSLAAAAASAVAATALAGVTLLAIKKRIVR